MTRGRIMGLRPLAFKGVAVHHSPSWGSGHRHIFTLTFIRQYALEWRSTTLCMLFSISFTTSPTFTTSLAASKAPVREDGRAPIPERLGEGGEAVSEENYWCLSPSLHAHLQREPAYWRQEKTKRLTKSVTHEMENDCLEYRHLYHLAPPTVYHMHRRNCGARLRRAAVTSGLMYIQRH